MEVKIDPHYHIKQGKFKLYDDGEDGLMDSIDTAENLGLAALVITSHVGGGGESYKINRTLMRAIRPKKREGQYPVIIGMELTLPPKLRTVNEVLVFGTELCTEIAENISEIRKYDLEAFKKLKESYENSAIVCCHPRMGFPEELLPIIDGCEITKSGIAVPNHEKIIRLCEEHGKTWLVSSDGHMCREHSTVPLSNMPVLGTAYNIMAVEIKDEQDLVRAIKENLILERIYSRE